MAVEDRNFVAEVVAEQAPQDTEAQELAGQAEVGGKAPPRLLFQPMIVKPAAKQIGNLERQRYGNF